jgi:hypothetical protein
MSTKYQLAKSQLFQLNRQPVTAAYESHSTRNTKLVKQIEKIEKMKIRKMEGKNIRWF